MTTRNKRVQMIHKQSRPKRQPFHTQRGKKYSAVELQEFREAVLGLREAAVNDVKSIREAYATSLTNDDHGAFDHGVGFDERSSHGSALAENAELIERQLQLIARLDAALRRINGGNYGICKSCEQQIDRMRLLAVPHTQECMTCKSLRPGLSSGVQRTH